MSVLRAVYAIDVGSTRSKPPAFAWVRTTPTSGGVVEGSQSADELVEALSSDFLSGVSVALGFEAPLYIPVPHDSIDLSKSRAGDGAFPWSAPVGLAVTTLALHQAAWILRQIVGCASTARYSTDHRDWPSSDQSLLVWEAFVSGSAHSDEHVRDAATAAMAFMEHENDLDAADAVSGDHALATIGAAALWSGWAEDVSVLQESVLTLKPEAPYAGAIARYGPVEPHDEEG